MKERARNKSKGKFQRRDMENTFGENTVAFTFHTPSNKLLLTATNRAGP